MADINKAPFAENDLVRLLLGGPVMQVTYPVLVSDEVGWVVTCIWFNKNDELQAQNIAVKHLVAATRLN